MKKLFLAFALLLAPLSVFPQTQLDAGSRLKNQVRVPNGGTGLASVTAHCVVVGAGTSAAHLVCPVSPGYVLTDNGSGFDPAFEAPIGGTGTGNVSTAPAATQRISQPAGTVFGVNNLNGCRSPFPTADAGDYNFIQSPAGSISIGANTVTLTPVPLGVNGTDTDHYVYLAGTGTPEAVKITGGTAVGGATSGTITFTALNAHGGGFTIQTASGGIKEASVDAMYIPTNPSGTNQGGCVKVPNGYEAPIYATLYIESDWQTVDFSGSILDCLTPSGACLKAGDDVAGGTDYADITFLSPRLRAMAVSSGPGIADNSQTTHISDIRLRNGLSGKSFANLLEIDADESATIDGLDPTANWAPPCTAAYCATMVIMPLGSGNYAVPWLSHINGTLNCLFNGIANFQGNTTHISDSVIQGYPEFGIYASDEYIADPSLEATNVYEEAGGCTNPLYGYRAQMGVGIAGQGKYSGVGPAGQFPTFVSSTSGSTALSVYLVAHSSVWGATAPLFVGECLTNGTGTCTVMHPCIGQAAAGTITYDYLAVPGVVGTTLAPNSTGNYSYATGVAQACVAGMQSETITVSASPASYGLPSVQYFPFLGASPTQPFWPAPIALMGSYDGGNQDNGCSQYFTDYLDFVGGPIASVCGLNEPTVHALSFSTWAEGGSSVWIEAPGADPSMGGFGAQLMNLGAVGLGGLTGSLGFEAINSEPTEVITLGYANPYSVISKYGHRIPASANDTWIGLDQTTDQYPTAYQLGVSAPVSIDLGIGQTPATLAANTLFHLTSAELLLGVPHGSKAAFFAALPACASGTEGLSNAVKDSTTNTWGATVTGGGADHIQAYCDGTNWTVAAQ